jgi:tetratricopeptide (TPR) repeat protein
VTSIRRLVYLLVVLTFLQPARAQTDSPKRLIDALPRDKSPEQLLALLALNLGVEESKNGTYDRAVRYLIESKRLDPDLLNARLYLSTAYASQYVPASTTPENVKNGQAAEQEFRATLQIAQENLSAIDGLGSILYQMANTSPDQKKLEESKSLFKKHIQIASKDAEPYYWVGVIDWNRSFGANRALRSEFNSHAKENLLSDTDPLPPDLRTQYAKELGAVIDEGIDCMQRAMDLRADYDDAMAYLNLLYRRKADTVENQDERAQFLKMADDLVAKVKDIKERRAEQPSRP